MKTNRALQLHPSLAKGADPEEALRFLEDFRLLQSDLATNRQTSRLISMKVPEPLLRAFRIKAEAQGLRYQTLIKQLMTEWLAR